MGRSETRSSFSTSEKKKKKKEKKKQCKKMSADILSLISKHQTLTDTPFTHPPKVTGLRVGECVSVRV